VANLRETRTFAGKPFRGIPNRAFRAREPYLNTEGAAYAALSAVNMTLWS
jgi:hypothetical protein